MAASAHPRTASLLGEWGLRTSGTEYQRLHFVAAEARPASTRAPGGPQREPRLAPAPTERRGLRPGSGLGA